MQHFVLAAVCATAVGMSMTHGNPVGLANWQIIADYGTCSKFVTVPVDLLNQNLSVVECVDQTDRDCRGGADAALTSKVAGQVNRG